MNHRLAAHVDFPGANNLGDVRRVIGLQQCYLNPLSGVVAFGLGKENRQMVRCSVPVQEKSCRVDKRSNGIHKTIAFRMRYPNTSLLILSVDILNNGIASLYG